MQDRILELQVKLRVIKDNPDLWRIVADLFNTPPERANEKVACLKRSYLAELREISDKNKKEAEKQQKLF